MQTAQPESDRTALAQDILSYWRTLAFLSQRDFPHPPASDPEDPVGVQFESGPLRVFPTFEAMSKRILATAKKAGRRPGEYITVYIGKVDREKLIASAARSIGLSDKRPEKDTSQIACACFQIYSDDGTYVPGTFSLSPVLWAAGALSDHVGPASDKLDEHAYREAQSHLEKILDPDPQQEYVLTPADIRDLWEGIGRCFPADVPHDAGGPEAVFAYVCEDYKGGVPRIDSYDGLGNGRFARDLALVAAALQKKRADLPAYLEPYILALHDKASRESGWVAEDLRGERRFDVVWNRQDGWYEDVMGEIQRITHAPLGKWPTWASPSFLAQAVINLTMAQTELQEADPHDAFRSLNGIFSANTLPGTDFPPLIREMVAASIVERALIMAEENDPDAFFERVTAGGPYEEEADEENGKGAGWYQCTDARLAHSGIVIAAPDAFAADEIAESLTSTRQLVAELSAGDRDPQDEGLRRVRRIIESREGKKLYFSQLADLLYTGVAPASSRRSWEQAVSADAVSPGAAWALVAAPLTDEQAVQRFVYTVLSPLLTAKGEYAQWWHLRGQDRLKEYETTRLQFISQLNKVARIQKSIDCEYLEEKVAEATRKKDQAMAGVHEQEKLQEQAAQAAEEARQHAADLQAQIEDTTARMQEAAESAEPPKQTLLSRIGARRRRYEQDLWAAEESQETYELLKDELSSLFQESARAKEDAELAEQVVQERQLRIDEWRAVADPWERAEASWQQQLQTALQAAKGAPDDEDCYVLDEDFFTALSDADSDNYATAHGANPWSTASFNREREKLLLSALALCREFILSSEAMHANLHALKAYWEGEGAAHVPVETLMQTLSLLVPVITTTFAFAGHLFAEVTEPGALGLLIAAQASAVPPHEAAGLLYRSTKALVLGDTRSEAPLIPPDQDALRSAFGAEQYLPYQAKDASVLSSADYLNPFGTAVEDNTSTAWMGGPLVYHRGLGDPMFEIANELSYDTLLVRDRRPPERGPYILGGSRWIQVPGQERGTANHYVPAQGRYVADMIRNAFELTSGRDPDILVLTPFQSVANAVREELNTCPGVDPEWVDTHVGTIEEFGPEHAKEVILVLGCGPNSRDAVRSVDRTAITAATTHAGARLYVLGDIDVWRESPAVRFLHDQLERYEKMQEDHH